LVVVAKSLLLLSLNPIGPRKNALFVFEPTANALRVAETFNRNRAGLISRLLPTSDGGALVVGTGGEDGPWVKKISATTAQTWRTNLGHDGPTLFDAAQVDEQRFALCGGYGAKAFAVPGNVWVSLLDSEGRVVNKTSFPGISFGASVTAAGQ